MRPHHALAGATALIALAGSTHAANFTVVTAAVLNDNSITPSAGSFRTQLPQPNAENAFLTSGNITVLNDRITWRDNLDQLMASTWLDLDPLGPAGVDGNATYGTGWSRTLTDPAGNNPVNVPAANASIGDFGLAVNGANGDTVNGDGLSPGFFADPSGFGWSAPIEDDFEVNSAFSQVNARGIESIHAGHFVLTDPNASLVGGDLLVVLDANAGYFYLPLDGGFGNEIHPITKEILGPTLFRLEYERTTFTNSLGTFTALDMYIVPAPATALAPLAVIPAFRRRR